ncbi:hypothetical protein EON65_38540 [archaeon]|nr:MAG: hypothetical protein EON65_38540 [archaeon]
MMPISIKCKALSLDLFMRLYYHHTHEPITLSLLGVRAKKYNVFIQIVTIVLLPTLILTLKHLAPGLSSIVL